MTEERIQKLADEIAGIMYKRSDCDDDVTWLPSDKFHEAAILIIGFLRLDKAVEWTDDDMARCFAEGILFRSGHFKAKPFSEYIKSLKENK